MGEVPRHPDNEGPCGPTPARLGEDAPRRFFYGAYILFKMPPGVKHTGAVGATEDGVPPARPADVDTPASPHTDLSRRVVPRPAVVGDVDAPLEGHVPLPLRGGLRRRDQVPGGPPAVAGRRLGKGPPAGLATVAGPGIPETDEVAGRPPHGRIHQARACTGGLDITVRRGPHVGAGLVPVVTLPRDMQTLGPGPGPPGLREKDLTGP